MPYADFICDVVFAISALGVFWGIATVWGTTRGRDRARRRARLLRYDLLHAHRSRAKDASDPKTKQCTSLDTYAHCWPPS